MTFWFNPSKNIHRYILITHNVIEGVTVIYVWTALQDCSFEQRDLSSESGDNASMATELVLKVWWIRLYVGLHTDLHLTPPTLSHHIRTPWLTWSESTLASLIVLSALQSLPKASVRWSYPVQSVHVTGQLAC